MTLLRALVHGVAIVAFAACASSSGGSKAATSSSTVAPSPDPRVGLKPGRYNAGEAQWNMKLVSNNPSPSPFDSSTNSDLAFYKNYVIQGSYDGFQVWDISTPGKPTLKKAYYCPASQSDVSVYRNLLFVSGEGTGGRLDCAATGVRDSVSNARLRGIRIFDITDITSPKYIANVQTCRGSHTHTVVIDLNDSSNVYVYVSGSAPVRSPTELPGCVRQSPDSNPNSSLFRIEVIKVPLAAPQTAAVIGGARIFDSLAAPAAATGCCSTSATRRIRAASPRSPIPTSPTGTRRRSTMTARSCSSRMSGAAAGSPSAARSTSPSGAPTRSSR